MICRRCFRASSSLLRPSPLSARSISQPFRALTTTSQGETPAKSPLIAAAEFSNPLSSIGEAKESKKATVLPVSIAPEGSRLKGINYLKGRDDPLAKKEEDYPEWLWHCLDAKKTEDGGDDGIGDEFSKSKKLRRKAAKRARKLEAMRLASGDTSVLEARVPLTQQSIDLPWNKEGTTAGALGAGEKREELREAMRRERRKHIKEKNFLKGM